jgi:hypothetical protein
MTGELVVCGSLRLGCCGVRYTFWGHMLAARGMLDLLMGGAPCLMSTNYMLTSDCILYQGGKGSS